MPKWRKRAGETTTTSTPAGAQRLDAVAYERPGDVVRVARVRRRQDDDLHVASQAPREHGGRGDREQGDDVEVVEGHRQVEDVRGHRRDERRGEPPPERPDARRERVADRRERATDVPRRSGPAEEVDEERREHERPDEPRLDERGDVERVRPEVRLPRLELVVHGERVEAEPEERVLREHVGDEVVDEEVRRRAAPLRREPRGDDLLEERGSPREEDEEHPP